MHIENLNLIKLNPLNNNNKNDNIEKIENFVNLKYLIFPNEILTLNKNKISDDKNNKLFYKKRILNNFLMKKKLKNNNNNNNNISEKKQLVKKNLGKWTKKEKELFLEGKKNLGNNWTKISKLYVLTRNRIQIASHNQCLEKKKFKKNNIKKKII